MIPIVGSGVMPPILVPVAGRDDADPEQAVIAVVYGHVVAWPECEEFPKRIDRTRFVGIVVGANDGLHLRPGLAREIHVHPSDGDVAAANTVVPGVRLLARDMRGRDRQESWHERTSSHSLSANLRSL